MESWITAQASVVGSSHIESGSPCQDAHVVREIKANEWLVAVVCDGAGSASRSDEGAQYVANFVADEFCRLADLFDSRPPGSWINDFLLERILELRAELKSLAGKDDIQELNCTLVACLVGPDGGFSLHIGDGNLVGGYTEKDHNPPTRNLYHSLPENGEYANETFFITENHWVKHIRLTSLPPLDWVLCLSDGGAALAMEGEKTLKDKFLIPVINDVFKHEDSESRLALLEKYLKDPKADSVTSDDKTMVVACKSSVIVDMEEYITKAQQTQEEMTVRRSTVGQTRDKNESYKPSTIQKEKQNDNLSLVVIMTLLFIELILVYIAGRYNLFWF